MAAVACKFIVHFLMSFSTTSFRTASQRPSSGRLRRASQELARSSPEGGLPFFVATSSSNNVAVLRTFPAIVMSASETRGCCSAREVQTGHSPCRVVELRAESQSKAWEHALTVARLSLYIDRLTSSLVGITEAAKTDVWSH